MRMKIAKKSVASKALDRGLDSNRRQLERSIRQMLAAGLSFPTSSIFQAQSQPSVTYRRVIE